MPLVVVVKSAPGDPSGTEEFLTPGTENTSVYKRHVLLDSETIHLWKSAKISSVLDSDPLFEGYLFGMCRGSESLSRPLLTTTMRSIHTNNDVVSMNEKNYIIVISFLTAFKSLLLDTLCIGRIGKCTRSFRWKTFLT